MPVITAVIVGIFGAPTLIFNDDTFIKMKPTIVQALLCAILWAASSLENAVETGHGIGLAYDRLGWRILTRNFGLPFAAMAVVNEIVWRTQSEEFWVTVVFGSIALTRPSA